MKLLVATTTGWQPATDPDMHVIPGEILIPAEQCDRRHCICRREFVGVTSYERTLHAKVVDLDISDDQLFDIAREYVVYMFGEPDLDEIGAYVHDLKIAEDAALAEPGAVIERWGYEYRDVEDNLLPDDDGDDDAD